MTEYTAPTIWSSGVVGTLLGLIILISILLRWSMQPKTVNQQQKRVSPVEKKSLKQHAIRIEEISPEISLESLVNDLQAIVKADPDLCDSTRRIEPHFLCARGQTLTCATVTFHSNVSAEILARKLTSAANEHRYRFDANFQGITPVYESSTDVDVVE